MNYFLYTIIFLYIANGGRFRNVLTSLIKPKLKTSSLEDEKLLSFVQRKTGLNFKFKIAQSPRMFGYSAGTPLDPSMVLSSGIYNNLTWDELQWVVLHEAGHTKLWHVAKNFICQGIIFLLGLFITSSVPFNGFQFAQTTAILLLALGLAILNFQVERRFSEYEADQFALKNMDDPFGMVTANQKFKDYWSKHSKVYGNNLLIRLFTPHLSYDERIEMAKRESNRRGLALHP